MPHVVNLKDIKKDIYKMSKIFFNGFINLFMTSFYLFAY
jgi:hypothetical protein